VVNDPEEVDPADPEVAADPVDPAVPDFAAELPPVEVPDAVALVAEPDALPLPPVLLEAA